MNIKQLQHLIAVADYGSVTRAAEKLHISQPAITRSIQMLEQELEIQLLERTTRKIFPTSAGRIFIRRANLILAELKSSQNELAAVGDDKKSVVVVTGSPLTASKLIPDAVSRLIERHKDLWVNIRGELDSNYAWKLKALRDGEVDVVISVTDLPMQQDGLIREQLLVPELRIIARRGHPLSATQDQSMRELSKYPWILPPANSVPRVVFDNEFNAEGVPTPKEYLEIANRQTILSIVKQSDILTAIPYHPACIEDSWSDIDVLPTRFSIRPISLSIITRSRTHLTPAAQAFIEITKELVEEAEANWNRQDT